MQTNLSPDGLLDEVLAVYGELERTNLENAAIKQWMRTQADFRPMSLRVRVIQCALHVIRRWRAGVPGFDPSNRLALMMALIADAWRFQGRECADHGAYAEIRRLLPKPFLRDVSERRAVG